MIAALLVAGALAAQEPPDCEEPMSQSAMNHCAALDFQRADAELNAVWPETVAQARALDRDIPDWDERPTHEARLREAQRAWIVFRDAHCAWEGYLAARGGSMEPMIYNGCRARLTDQRIEQLRAADPYAER